MNSNDQDQQSDDRDGNRRSLSPVVVEVGGREYTRMRTRTSSDGSSVEVVERGSRGVALSQL